MVFGAPSVRRSYSRRVPSLAFVLLVLALAVTVVGLVVPVVAELRLRLGHNRGQ
jgi:hypothetical protein